MVYLELFFTFLKVGLFTIGGGLAMIPVIADQTITRGWISSELLYDFIAVAESTPGPFAVNVATFVGYQTGGFLGAVCAILGIFLPSFVIILIIFKVSHRFINSNIAKDLFTGLRPAVVGLIISALITIGYSTLYTDRLGEGMSFNYIGLLLLAILLLVRWKFKKIHPIFLIVLSAGLGMLLYSFLPH